MGKRLFPTVASLLFGLPTWQLGTNLCLCEWKKELRIATEGG